MQCGEAGGLAQQTHLFQAVRDSELGLCFRFDRQSPFVLDRT